MSENRHVKIKINPTLSDRIPVEELEVGRLYQTMPVRSGSEVGIYAGKSVFYTLRRKRGQTFVDSFLEYKSDEKYGTMVAIRELDMKFEGKMDLLLDNKEEYAKLKEFLFEAERIYLG